MARALLWFVFLIVGIVGGAELLLRAFSHQPDLTCPEAGTVIVVAGVSADDAELAYGCVDGDRFVVDEVELSAAQLRIKVTRRAYEQLTASPRIKVIAVHHGDVGASAFLRGVDVLAPSRRLRPWDYPDRDVRPLDLPKPALQESENGKRHYLSFELDDERVGIDTHVSIIADAPRPGTAG